MDTSPVDPRTRVPAIAYTAAEKDSIIAKSKSERRVRGIGRRLGRQRH